MKIKSLLLGLWVLVGIGFQPEILKSDDLSYYRARIWTSKDGLPQNSISGLMQSRDGYLWFITLEGLVRFDGHQVKVFNSNTYPDDFVFDRLIALGEDKQGVIWASTEEGGVYSLQGEEVTYHKLESFSPNQYITSILGTSNGDVLLGTTSGVYKHANGSFSPWYQHELKSLHITKITERNDGTYWIATSSGLYRTDKSTGKLVLDPFTRDSYINDFVFTDERTAIIIMGNELYVQEERMYRKLFPPKELQVPFKLMTDTQGGVWIGTGGYGLWYWKGLNFQKVNDVLGFQQDVIWSLYEDDEHNIWIGTNGGGIIKLTKGLFKTISEHDGLTHPIVWSLSESNDRSIWASTYFGVSQVWGSSIKNYALEGVSSQFVWTILASSQGIYAGTNGNGLFKLNENEKIFKAEKSVPKKVNIVKVLAEDSQSQLWMGTVNGLFKKSGKDWFEIRLPNEHKNIKTFFEDHEQTKWFGTTNGIFYAQNDSIYAYPIPDFPKVAVRYMHQPDKNTMLFATEGLGLLIYHNKQLKRLTIDEGLNSNFISTVVTLDSTVWISTNSGITSFHQRYLNNTLENETQHIPTRVYNELDGMMNAETNGGIYPNIIVDEFGKLWYPSMAGIAVLDTKEALEEQRIQPKIVLDELYVDGKPVNPSYPIQLEYEHNQLSLRFSVIHFANPDRFSFAYRQSESHEWIALGKSPAITVNQVAPGKQTWEFSVWNQEGQLIHSEQIPLFKSPHFSESWWFYSLMIAIGIGLGYVLYRLRIIQIKRSEVKLNALIHERTQALEEEKEKSEKALLKLAKINDQLKAANKMKNDFLSIAAHDLKNPLNGVMGFSELLVEEFQHDARLKQMAMFIQKSSEKMLEMIERLLEQGKMNEALMNMKLEKTDISEIAWTSAAEFFPIAKKKQQKITLSMGNSTIIQADPFWLRECIDNLISNALKYSPLGTQIHVRTQHKDHEVWFEVQDSGPGIAKEDQEKIFEPYKRLDHKTTGGESSTGLGLSIVKRVMDQHHARIEVDSEMGVGSTFRLIFQLDEVSA